MKDKKRQDLEIIEQELAQLEKTIPDFDADSILKDYLQNLEDEKLLLEIQCKVHILKKYGEIPYTVAGCNLAGLLNQHDELRAWLNGEQYETQIFRVVRSKNSDGSTSMYDTLLGLLQRDALRASIEPIVSSVFPDAKIIPFSNDLTDETLSGQMTLEAFRETNPDVRFWIFTWNSDSHDDFDAKALAIGKQWQELGYADELRFFQLQETAYQRLGALNAMDVFDLPQGEEAYICQFYTDDLKIDR